LFISATYQINVTKPTLKFKLRSYFKRSKDEYIILTIILYRNSIENILNDLGLITEPDLINLIIEPDLIDLDLVIMF